MNTNESIGTALRRLRKESGLSAKDATRLLETRYSIKMSPYTLFSYEKDRCTTDPFRFLALCMIYRCKDVLYEFGFTDNPFSCKSLKKEDQEILKKFHSLPDSGKDLIRGALGIEKPKQKKGKTA